MKIGVTSQNFRTITPHAGMARRFMIFETAADNQIIQTGQLDLPKEMAMHEHSSQAPHPIDEIDALITGSCGQGLAQKLAARGIRVIVTSETDPVTAVTAWHRERLSRRHSRKTAIMVAVSAIVKAIATSSMRLRRLRAALRMARRYC